MEQALSELNTDPVAAKILKSQRKAPETIQEYKDEAIRMLQLANSRYAEASGNSSRYMAMARRHVEAAELLQRLEDLHR